MIEQSFDDGASVGSASIQSELMWSPSRGNTSPLTSPIAPFRESRKGRGDVFSPTLGAALHDGIANQTTLQVNVVPRETQRCYPLAS